MANALAESNLRVGRSVIADCVNPVRASRQGWQAVAARVPGRLVDIHLVGTDATEHRRRVESRVADISGHVMPTWQQVMQHEFEEGDDEPVVLDTAAMTPAELVYLSQPYLGRTGCKLKAANDFK